MSDDVSIPAAEFRGSRAGRYGTAQRAVSGGMDPDMKRMALFAAGIAGVLVVLFTASALTGHRSGEVPVVAAPPGPVRVKPADPGGMKVDAAENELFSGGTDNGAAKLSPPAEAPDTKALRAAAPPPVAQAAPVPPPVPPVAPARPGVVASASAPPARPGVVASASAPPAKPGIVASASAPPAKPAIVAAAVPAAKPATEPAKKAMVQLAAMASEEAARDEWQRLSKKMPELLGGRQPSYSKTEHDGHVFWRVRTPGFGDVAQARAFCDRVRAKGATCSVADF